MPEGFFRRAGNVLENLGDALAGVDREAAFRQGLQERAQYDYTNAQTEAAMELARQRRIEAQIAEMQRAARERVQRMQAQQLADPSSFPMGDIIVGELGSQYSGAMQGRNYGQEFQLRERVAEPALGDAVLEQERVAAMEALSPASAVASRRAPGAEPLVIAVDPETGEAVYTPRSQAVGRRPGARPPSSGVGPTSQQRNVDDLVRRGVPEELAIRIVYNETPDPRGAYIAIYNALRRNFEEEESAAAEARQLVEQLYPGALEQLAEPLIQPPEPELPVITTPEEAAALPPGTRFIAPDGSIRVRP